MSTGNDRARSRNPTGSRVAETLVDPRLACVATPCTPCWHSWRKRLTAPADRSRYAGTHANGRRGGWIRQMMRRQSIRCWWNLRSRRYKAGGVANKLQRKLIERVFPASPTVTADGIPLASPEYDVATDPVAERSLWDTWGRDAWLCIVASEQNFIVYHGFIFEMSRVQFKFDFHCPQCLIRLSPMHSHYSMERRCLV